MKSMSWLLYENESSVLRECRACGFSTRSPSIYRRHSRRCGLPSPSLQQSNGKPLVTDFPNVSSECSAGFLEVHSDLPSADFPDIACEHSVGFSDIGLLPPVSGKLPVAKAVDSPDPDLGKCLEKPTVSKSLDKSGTSVKSPREVQQLLTEFTSDSVPVPSTSSPVVSNLAPVNTESPSADCVADIPYDQPMSGPDNELSSMKSTDTHLNKGDAVSSLPHDAANNVPSSSEQQSTDDVFDSRSHSANPVDSETRDTQDGLKVDCKLVDSSEAETKSGLPAAENITTMDDSRVDTSLESTSGEIQRSSKKSARKSSSPLKPRRCKHCKVVLSSRMDRRTHMQAKHPDMIPVFHCTDCNYHSIEHKNYERHLLRHLLAGPFRCDKCSFSSTSQSSIKRHVALQHNSQANAADSVNGSAEIQSPVSEIPAAPDGVKSENLSLPSDQISTAGLPPDSDNSEKQKTRDSDDGAVSAEHIRGNTSPGGDSETKADISCTTSQEAAVTDSSKDMIQSVIEVEVKTCPGEDGGEEETWWTCLACGARYNERAKVRRHVKCKHRVPLTSCRLHDLRTTPSTHNTSNSFSAANDLIQKLQEARSSAKAQATTSSSQPLTTSEKQSITAKTRCSLVSSGMKLQPKSFVKIAPKPFQIDGNCQIFTASAPIVNSKRQVVLPKRNWKQMTVSFQPADGAPESLSVIKDSDAERKHDSESEIKPLTTDKPADGEEVSVPTVVQQVAKNEAGNDASFSLIPVTLDVPKKKRRLILRAKNTKMFLEPCSNVVGESSDAAKETNLNPACLNILPLEHSYNVDGKEHGSRVDDPTSEQPLDRVSETNDEHLEKTPEVKRQFGIKRTSPLKCAHCRFTCFRLPDLRHHLLEHTGDKVYECDKCSRSFRNKIGLYLHEQRKHKAHLTHPSDVSQTDKSAPTDLDTEQISTETEKSDIGADEPKLKKKRIRSSSPNSQLTQKTDQQIPNDGEASAGNEEGVITSGSADVREKSCEKKERSAGKRCTETVEMVQPTDKSDHFKIVIRRRSSAGEEILETIDGVNNGMMCKFCGYMAKIPVQLTQHMKIHTGERDYWCVIGDCTYRTIWRCDMKRHLRKFHLDEVERQGGNYYDLLQRSYQPSKLKDDASSSLSAESLSETVNVLKMSKRQRRRLLKLQNRELSKLTTREIPDETESQEGVSSIVSSSPVADDTKEPASAAGSEAKKDDIVTKSVERFRPYKCSECGRRSNWRWDLKKHIQAAHKNAVIIKLNDDVARATFADIYLSHGGRNGIRFPRRRSSSDVSLSTCSKAESRSNCNGADGNSQTEESGTDADGKRPVSELERTLARPPTAVKSIGMIDMLRLKRFQCSGCPYRSNHRGDLGRHIRMRHGRGNCTVSVLSADVAAATLHAYRLQWNRKKAWLPKTETAKVDKVKTSRKFRCSSRSAEMEETTDKVPEVAEDAEKTAAESEHADNAGSRKHHFKEFWYLDDGNDETKCCDICPFKTDRTGLLELHKLRHRAPAAAASSSSVTFSCPHCPYFVRTSRQLERHTALHEDVVQSHSETFPEAGGVQQVPRCGPAKNRYVCEKCPFVSMFRNEFWLHRRLHFIPRVDVPYSCDLCPFWVSDRRVMSEHAVLHTQSYYPRLSVPVVSRYRPADVEKSIDGNDGENCHGRVVSDGSQCEVVADVVDDMKSKKSINGDDDMEVEGCPELEAVDQLVAAVSEAELPDCCPLLEPECDPSLVKPSEVSVSNTCPTLCAETSVHTPSSSAVGGDAATSDSGVVLLKVNNGADSNNEICAPDHDMKTNALAAGLTLPAELSSAPASTEVVGVVTSEGDSVLSKNSNGTSEDGMSADDRAETANLKSHSQPADVCPTLCAMHPTLTTFSGSDGGVVSEEENKDVSDGGILPVDYSENVEETSSCRSPDTSLGGSQRNHMVNADLSPEHNTKASSDSVPATGSTEVSGYQISDAVVNNSMQALDTNGRRDDDALLEINAGASDDEKPAGDRCEGGKIHVKVEISDHQITAASSVGESNSKVESKADGSWNDGACTCSLQCPYCFFAIASVRLLRQHIMFHVAMSDAARVPVFHPRLDGVEDGRMDDRRCADLVQLCNRCRHLANLGNADPVVVPETSSSFVGSGNRDLGSADQMTVLELEDKTAFLSQLSLRVS